MLPVQAAPVKCVTNSCFWSDGNLFKTFIIKYPSTELISKSFRDWALWAACVVHKTRSQYFKNVTEHATQLNWNPRVCWRNPSGKGAQPIALKVLPRLTAGPGPACELTIRSRNPAFKEGKFRKNLLQNKQARITPFNCGSTGHGLNMVPIHGLALACFLCIAANVAVRIVFHSAHGICCNSDP